MRFPWRWFKRWATEYTVRTQEKRRSRYPGHSTIERDWDWAIECFVQEAYRRGASDGWKEYERRTKPPLMLNKD